MPSTATVFPLRLRLFSKTARVGSVKPVEKKPLTLDKFWQERKNRLEVNRMPHFKPSNHDQNAMVVINLKGSVPPRLL